MTKIIEQMWVNDNGLVAAWNNQQKPSFDIFDASNWHGSPEEAQEIANMIAAAPDMYKTLKMFLSVPWLDENYKPSPEFLRVLVKNAQSYVEKAENCDD